MRGWLSGGFPASSWSGGGGASWANVFHHTGRSTGVGHRTAAAVRRARSTWHAACWALLLVLGQSLWSRSGAAQESPEIHGFVSQGFILTSKNEFLAKSKHGSVEFSEAALNFTHSPTERLRLGFQLFAHELGPTGNYQPQFDWYYLDYRFADWLGVRVGRTKMPFGLYNEVNDIDVARVPILLPQSIYQLDHREFIYAQTGAELYGEVKLGPAGALEYRAYGGTLSLEGAPPPSPVIQQANTRVAYVYGGRLLWLTPLDGLLAGMSGQALRLDSDISFDPALQAAFEGLGLLTPGVTYPTPVKWRVRRWVASLQYAAHDLDVSAEYSRWTGAFLNSPGPLLTPHIVNERYFVMASYRIAPWFTPGAYYAALFTNVEDRNERGRYQHDWAVTTRFDLNAHWILKLEGHLMRGSAYLDDRRLNDGLGTEELPQAWGAFLVKTTAYF